MKNKQKGTLLKLTITIGVLIGASIKIWDFINIGWFRCGIFNPPSKCNLGQFLKEVPIWMLLGLIFSFIIIYGAKYLIKYSKDLIKNRKKDFKKKVKEKPTKKESSKKIKKSSKRKKVIKI